jgi:hypothetical protein
MRDMGMTTDADSFGELMNTLNDIKTEIEGLSERRGEILHQLSQGHNPELVAERNELDERIAELWDLYRAERARVRFGERDLIIARARHEERLERAAA